MADDDNLVLRLLREIRDTQTDDHRRLIKVGRRLDELHETATASLGMAAHSVAAVGQQGDRFDEMTDQIEALQRRVADLEAKI